MRYVRSPFLAVCLLCMVWLLWPAAPCMAQDAGPLPDNSGPTKPAGTVGGPCLGDGTCTDGSSCFKLNEQPICLFPPNTGSPTGQNCPPQRQFIQCDPNGNNCRIVCYEIRGFGCEASPQLPLRSWWLLALFLCGGLGSWHLRRRTSHSHPPGREPTAR